MWWSRKHYLYYVVEYSTPDVGEPPLSFRVYFGVCCRACCRSQSTCSPPVSGD
jgi:hypothetical protein